MDGKFLVVRYKPGQIHKKSALPQETGDELLGFFHPWNHDSSLKGQSATATELASAKIVSLFGESAPANGVIKVCCFIWRTCHGAIYETGRKPLFMPELCRTPIYCHFTAYLIESHYINAFLLQRTLQDKWCVWCGVRTKIFTTKCKNSREMKQNLVFSKFFACNFFSIYLSEPVQTVCV